MCVSTLLTSIIPGTHRLLPRPRNQSARRPTRYCTGVSSTGISIVSDPLLLSDYTLQLESGPSYQNLLLLLCTLAQIDHDFSGGTPALHPSTPASALCDETLIAA